jgi:hypothetical protein
MYRLIKLSLILTAAALSCWTAPVLADHNVPFKSSGSGIVTGLDQRNLPFVSQEYYGTGVASHLGYAELSGGHTLLFLSAHGGLILDGTFTLTAADGSKLSGTYDNGTFQREGEVVYLSGTFRFETGTDRLAGVTGEADTDVTAAGRDVGSTFFWNMEGTLTFPDRPRE